MGQRPAHVKPPKHLSPSPSVPKPEPIRETADPMGINPVRYGDWELKGVAIDF